MIIDSPIISGSQLASGPLTQIGDVYITGSLNVLGAINGSITGSITSASYATSAEFLDGLDSTSFVFTSSFNTYSSSVSTRETNLEATASVLTTASASFAVVSSSFATTSGSLSTRVTNVEATASTNTQASASFAAYSASVSTRLTTDETNITTLTNASASFAAQSASLSTRLTTDESNFSTTSGSLSTRVTNLESTSSTVSSSFATTSGSIAGRVTTIESKYATTGSNTFTNLQYISATTNAASFTTSASFYTDGGARISKDLFVSGTSYFNNVVVYGTSSIQYLTSSQVNVGANMIYLNTQTPAVRFGGMAVADSGSNAGVTGSLLWDSVNNNWIYVQASGSTYSGGALISGPRNFGVIGSEQTTLANYVMKGQGGDHITASQIYSDDSSSYFYTNVLYVTASGNVGVGTTNTCTKLHVVKGLQSDTVSITNSAAYVVGNDVGLIVGQSAGVPYGIWMQSLRTTDSTSFPISLNPNGGNIGIGTANPSSALHVSGSGDTTLTIGISGANNPRIKYCGGAGVINRGTSTDAMYFGETADSGNYLFRGTGASCFCGNVCAQGFYASSLQSGITIDSTTNGDTIIASRGLNAALHGIVRTVGQNGVTCMMMISTRNSVDGNLPASVNAIWGLTNSDTVIATCNTERMRITSGGNVGIGCTTPSYTLDVNGCGRISGGTTNVPFQITSNSSNGTILGLTNTNGGPYNWGINAYSNGTLFFQYGTLGAGSNPFYVTSGGAGIFASSVTATQYNSTVSSGYNIVLNKGTGPAIQFNKTNATAQAWSINADPNFRFYDETAAIFPLTLTAGTGAATFACSVTANGNINITKVTPGLVLRGVDYGNSGAYMQLLGWASANPNWQISLATEGDGGLHFIPSTANGGTTFTTPVATIYSSGAATFTGNVCASAVVANQLSTGNQPPRSSAALFAYDGKAPAFFQNSSAGSHMFGKTITSVNNAPLTPLFVMCDIGGNTGIFAKVSILGTQATGATMYEDTGYAWYVYTGYTYRCSGYCIFNTVQPANGHSVGTLCWGGTAGSAPYLQYCAGQNGYTTELIDVKVVIRDSGNLYFCMNNINSG